MRRYKLKSENEFSANTKRVNVEALDLDWVFEEDNTKELIRLLA